MRREKRVECVSSPAERRELAIRQWQDEVEQMSKWAESALDEYLLAVKRLNRAKQILERFGGQEIAS